jgi:16S rRNA (adenine1518-N6/adenine1519-N6)-dimethyltransferase
MKHQARKRFGQHFLVDQSVIADIVGLINPQHNQHIVEIGPGQAALTKPLLEQVGSITALEIDRDLSASLRKRFGAALRLVEADALAYDFFQLNPQPLRVVGNLPYNISSPLLVHLIRFASAISDQVFMLQKEVVQRIVAPADTSDYGRLSVIMQAYWQPSMDLLVVPGAFDPPPAVDSAMVSLRHKADPLGISVLPALEQVLNVAFEQRRKMLRGRFLPWLLSQGIDTSGLPSIVETARAQEVSVEDYCQLALRLAAKA